MSISYNDVFPILANAMPGFEPTEDEREEPTPYFFLSDMVRFVCDRSVSGGKEEMKALAVLFERLASEGDHEVQCLLIDALEGLNAYCRNKAVVTQEFGLNTKQVWQNVVERLGEA